MAFRIYKGQWQFKKADGTYESKYKINDQGALVETDAEGNDAGPLVAATTWSDITGRPTSLSEFNNNLGNYGGWLTTSGKAADANLLDGIDSTGFLRSGGGTLSGNLTAPTYYINDTNTKLHEGGGNSLRIETNTGYIDIGSQNSGWIHFQGNKPYYFNQNTSFDADVMPYATDQRSLGTTSKRWTNVYVTGGDSSQWNTAYGWGDHASAGYAASSHNHDSRYLVKGGSWNGANMPGSRWGGFSVNGGEVVFQQDNPNTGQMSVMVDGNFYAGEQNGFWSLYGSGSTLNSYNAKVGFYSNSSGDFLISTSAVYAGGNQVWHAGNLTNNSSNWNAAYSWGNHAGLYLGATAKAADSNLLDGIDSASFLRSDTNDSFTGLLTATASDWYIYGLGTRGASAGAYGIGNRASDAYRQMTFHVPNLAAYSNSGTIPSFGWYSNGAVQLMKLDSDSGNLWTKGTIEADGRIYADDGLHVRGNWVRVNGSQGLYFESYGGGWHMTDGTWIRAYNSKPVYVDQHVRADQGFEVSGHRVIGADKNVNAASQVQIGNYVIRHNTSNNRLEFVLV